MYLHTTWAVWPGIWNGWLVIISLPYTNNDSNRNSCRVFAAEKTTMIGLTTTKMIMMVVMSMMITMTRTTVRMVASLMMVFAMLFDCVSVIYRAQYIEPVCFNLLRLSDTPRMGNRTIGAHNLRKKGDNSSETQQEVILLMLQSKPELREVQFAL